MNVYDQFDPAVSANPYDQFDAPQKQSAQTAQNPTLNPADDPYGLKAAEAYGQQQHPDIAAAITSPAGERLEQTGQAVADWASHPIGGGAPISPQQPEQPIRNVLRSVYNPVAGAYNFFLEPRNIALGAATLFPPTAEAGLAGFAAEMAPSATPMIKQVFEAGKQAVGIPVENPMTGTQGLEAGMQTALAAAPIIHAGIAPETGFRPLTAADAIRARTEAPSAAVEPSTPKTGEPAPPLEPVPEEQAFTGRPFTEPSFARFQFQAPETTYERINQELYGLGQPEILPQESKAPKFVPMSDPFGGDVTPVSSSIINDLGGIVSKSAASRAGRLEENTDLWNDAPSLSHPTHNKIYNPKGMMPDLAAQALYDAGYIPDPYPETMWRAIASESQTARRIVRENKIQQEQQYAIREQETGTLLQRQPEENGTPGGQRGRVEPGQQGLETAGEVTGREDLPATPDPPETTGIAQRISERQAAESKIGEIQPGQGASWQEMIARGDELIRNEGIDPDRVASEFSRDGTINGDRMAVLRARDTDLAHEATIAEEALRQNPNDQNLQAAYKQAFDRWTDWRQNKVKPAQTVWHLAGEAMQGEEPIDVTSYTGIRRAVVEQKGRDLSPVESREAIRFSDQVKQASAEENGVLGQFDQVVRKSLGNKRALTLDELRDRIAKETEVLCP